MTHLASDAVEPTATIGQIVRANVRVLLADFGEDPAPPLYDAICDAIDEAEMRALGVALCARHDALVDGSWRIGGADCDPHLQAVADAVGYADAGRA